MFIPNMMMFVVFTGVTGQEATTFKEEEIEGVPAAAKVAIGNIGVDKELDSSEAEEVKEGEEEEDMPKENTFETLTESFHNMSMKKNCHVKSKLDGDLFQLPHLGLVGGWVSPCWN